MEEKINSGPCFSVRVPCLQGASITADFVFFLPFTGSNCVWFSSLFLNSFNNTSVKPKGHFSYGIKQITKTETFYFLDIWSQHTTLRTVLQSHSCDQHTSKQSRCNSVYSCRGQKFKSPNTDNEIYPWSLFSLYDCLFFSFFLFVEVCVQVSVCVCSVLSLLPGTT